MPETRALITELLAHYLEQTLEYAVVVLDPEGTIMGWLGASERVFGYTSEDILGSHVGRLFVSEDAARGFDQQELAIARATGRSTDDRWHVRRDGSHVWITGAIEAVHDAEGRLAGFVKIGRDRTDLRTQLDSLMNEIAGAHMQVHRTKVFLGTLGHELRNPLAPLQMAAHIIRRAGESQTVHRAADTILSQTATISRLADDLMEATRLDSGQARLQLERVDLREIAQQAGDSFQALAADKRLNVDVVQSAAPLLVIADVCRLQQVLLNLLSNALKYTPPGGRVWVKTTQEDNEVVLRVEDTGMGIAAEVLPRIFDLFTREPAAVDNDPRGLGIGLAMVRQIVILHGGSVQARSAGHGYGSEFIVRLPAA